MSKIKNTIILQGFFFYTLYKLKAGLSKTNKKFEKYEVKIQHAQDDMNKKQKRTLHCT